MSPRDQYRPELENLEIELLLEAIDRLHGINLKDGSGGFGTPVRKRIWEAIKKERVRSVSGLQEKLLHDADALDRFLKTVLPPFVPYSAGFLQKFRYDLVPYLKTWPFIRVWQVGCNSVFETYCLAIILLEEGVYEKSVIYGTDVNEGFLQSCYDGVFPLTELEKYEKIYQKSGGRASLAQYFSGGGKSGMFDTALRKNMVFSRHNLATDSSFNEVSAIFCRNPLKFFERKMQDRAHTVLYESLNMFGILGLTQGETLEHAPTAGRFVEFDQENNLYRKVG
ncbi:MAG TPA: CheR family methyltransferase [Verrucomicrobiae bacterium]